MGMTDHAISRISEPSIGWASRPWRRRYFMPKIAITTKIASVVTTDNTTSAI